MIDLKKPGRLQGFTPYSVAEWGYAMPKIAGAAPAADISLERGAAAVVDVKT